MQATAETGQESAKVASAGLSQPSMMLPKGIHRPLVLRKASKKRKRVASAPPRRSKVSEDCVARVSMAASCFCFGHEKDGQDRVENATSAMAVLALLGLVKPSPRKPRQPRRRAPKPATAQAKPSGQGRGRPPGRPPRQRIEAPPIRTYKELLAKFQADKQARKNAESAQGSSKTLPEHYPSSRPDLLALRCRTDVFREQDEDPLELMLSWISAAARETGREDGTSKTSVLKSVWKTRSAPMLERVAAIRSRESARAQGKRRTMRSNATRAFLGDDASTEIVTPQKEPRVARTGSGGLSVHRYIDEGPLSPLAMEGRSSSSASRVGRKYQAVIPECREIAISTMTEAECQWLQGHMDLRGALGDKPMKNREDILNVTAPLGTKATEALGLKEMGAGGMVGWDGMDVALFREGLTLLGRDFPGIARALKLASLSGKQDKHQKLQAGLEELRRLEERPDDDDKRHPQDNACDPAWLRKVVAFYYNVWKVRGCGEAKAWYGPSYQGLGKEPMPPPRQRSVPPPPPKQQASAQPANDAKDDASVLKGTDSSLEGLLGTLKGVAKGSPPAATIPSNTTASLVRMQKALACNRTDEAPGQMASDNAVPAHVTSPCPPAAQATTSHNSQPPTVGQQMPYCQATVSTASLQHSGIVPTAHAQAVTYAATAQAASAPSAV